LTSGEDVSIFVTGHLVWKGLKAYEALAKENIKAEVINIHTIKPLDTLAVLESVSKTGCAVSAEEHLRNGGMGDSIAQLLITKKPVPMEIVAVDDRFGESGKPEELLAKYGLDTMDIIQAAKRAIRRK
jgi:transketolase